ncbi:uncharacterized protein [Ciconia boyciana]|uniref:uncharacterized protein isoform X2 n=1 Tax=Ciconia boyciana TaxID=52775 RepID=UPI003BA0124D
MAGDAGTSQPSPPGTPHVQHRPPGRAASQGQGVPEGQPCDGRPLAPRLQRGLPLASAAHATPLGKATGLRGHLLLPCPSELRRRITRKEPAASSALHPARLPEEKFPVIGALWETLGRFRLWNQKIKPCRVPTDGGCGPVGPWPAPEQRDGDPGREKPLTSGRVQSRCCLHTIYRDQEVTPRTSCRWQRARTEQAFKVTAKPFCYSVAKTSTGSCPHVPLPARMDSALPPTWSGGLPASPQWRFTEQNLSCWEGDGRISAPTSISFCAKTKRQAGLYKEVVNDIPGESRGAGWEAWTRSEAHQKNG